MMRSGDEVIEQLIETFCIIHEQGVTGHHEIGQQAVRHPW